MIGRRGIVLVVSGVAAAALPALAGAQSVNVGPMTTETGPLPTPSAAPAPPTRKPAHISLKLAGARHGRVEVGGRVRLFGHLRPFVPRQRVQVKLIRSGHVVLNLRPVVKRSGSTNVGHFRVRSRSLYKSGRYRMVAIHHKSAKQRGAAAHSKRFGIDYPDLDPGQRNGKVKLFNRLLSRDGYYTPHGRDYGAKTGFAVMAFRKVNGMRRTFNANPRIFKQVADGKGRFHLRYKGAGKHVEVDISRQVMVLANHGKAQYTFHVSTGAPATPTIRGLYHFYSRQPGYNSEGMYYSVYWHGGYAIHGYASVPPYPASHGCVRNEIADARFAYDWVRLGMSIYVYG